MDGQRKREDGSLYFHQLYPKARGVLLSLGMQSFNRAYATVTESSSYVVSEIYNDAGNMHQRQGGYVDAGYRKVQLWKVLKVQLHMIHPASITTYIRAFYDAELYLGKAETRLYINRTWVSLVKLGRCQREANEAREGEGKSTGVRSRHPSSIAS